MTRSQFITEIHRLSSCPFLSTMRDNPEGLPIDADDLDAIRDQKALNQLLKQVQFSVTDKGIWVRI